MAQVPSRTKSDATKLAIMKLFICLDKSWGHFKEGTPTNLENFITTRQGPHERGTRKC